MGAGLVHAVRHSYRRTPRPAAPEEGALPDLLDRTRPCRADLEVDRAVLGE